MIKWPKIRIMSRKELEAPIAKPEPEEIPVKVIESPIEEYKPKFSALEELIISHEGLRLVAYLDPVGVPTIGYGHTKTVTAADVGKKKISLEEAVRLLRDDLREPVAQATAVLGFSSGRKHRGVTSFIYNLGPGALHGKTTQIAYHLVRGDYLRAAAGMEKYVFGGGRRLPGLVTRRKEEAALVSQ